MLLRRSSHQLVSLTTMRVHCEQTVKVKYKYAQKNSQKPSSMSFEKRLRSRPTGVTSKKDIGQRMILRNTRSWSLVDALIVTYTITQPWQPGLPSLSTPGLTMLPPFGYRTISYAPTQLSVCANVDWLPLSHAQNLSSIYLQHPFPYTSAITVATVLEFSQKQVQQR